MNSKSKTFQKKVKANGKHSGQMNLEKEADNFKAGVYTILESSLPDKGETGCVLHQLCAAAEGRN